MKKGFQPGRGDCGGGGVQALFHHQEEKVLFIGTQFSNLSTAVDTSAAAA
jgi:hypothetical protein